MTELNEWFLTLDPAHQKLLTEDKWLLANTAWDEQNKRIAELEQKLAESTAHNVHLEKLWTLLRDYNDRPNFYSRNRAKACLMVRINTQDAKQSLVKHNTNVIEKELYDAADSLNDMDSMRLIKKYAKSRVHQLRSSAAQS